MAVMKDEMVEIADRVRGVTASRRLNQEAVAKHIGISRQTVSAKMLGKVPFTSVELLILARKLNVPIDQFYPPVIVQPIAYVEVSA